LPDKDVNRDKAALQPNFVGGGCEKRMRNRLTAVRVGDHF
jgi:hypothetical protein